MVNNNRNQSAITKCKIILQNHSAMAKYATVDRNRIEYNGVNRGLYRNNTWILLITSLEFLTRNSTILKKQGHASSKISRTWYFPPNNR